MDNNPLIGVGFRIPFDSIEAQHIEPAVDALIEEAEQTIEALAADSAPRTFENTLLALDDATESLERTVSTVGHLEGVATYPEFREAYNAIQPRVSSFFAKIPMNDRLWAQVRRYRDSVDAASLHPVHERFLTQTVRKFVRNGAELDEAGKKELESINIELAEITTRFAQNVLDATNDFELVITDETKLAGLPESAIDAARESAKSRNLEGWRFTLQGPSYVAVQTFLDDRAARETVYRAYATRCNGGGHDNAEFVSRILRLRRQRAELLGFTNFAELVLEERMAKTGSAAYDFVRGLDARTRASFERENAELAAFAASLNGATLDRLEPWDLLYYAEKLRKERFSFDEEELRPYFSFERVMEGMFAITSRLFGIEVVAVDDQPAWDESVRCYAIEDTTGERLGTFFADFFPRENKRGGAWMDALITGRPKNETTIPHVGIICGNLTPPVGDKPALLSHRDVETLFHEFGHLLHHLLSRVQIRSLAGTNVAWDFVELPSQIMENWCWERESLDMFARHWQTGAVIPDDLFAKMLRARTFRAANSQMRQLGFATADLELHVEFDPVSGGDPVAYSRDILERFSPAALPADHSMITAFTHLFASPVGYGAGYYSYKWSEVLDADAFTKFRADGVLNPEVGLAFRDAILARGDSEDPADLYRRFMGRDPDADALMARLGLAEVA